MRGARSVFARARTGRCAGQPPPSPSQPRATAVLVATLTTLASAALCQVEHVCVHCAAGTRIIRSPAITQLRAEAALVLQALFRGEGAGPGSRQPEPVPRWEGGLAVLDDDDAPSHAVAAMGEDGSASPSDDEDASFPPLPTHPCRPAPSEEKEPASSQISSGQTSSSWLEAAGRELPPTHRPLVPPQAQGMPPHVT